MNPKVDEYFIKASKWKAEMQALREIIIATELTEELKWGEPCYTLGKANVVLIHGFKEYCALLFFKGALMKDPQGNSDTTNPKRSGCASDSFYRYSANH